MAHVVPARSDTAAPAAASAPTTDPRAINAALPFPMWVCPVSTLLELATAGCGGTPLPTHDAMKEAGKIVPWEPGMNTMFFSHTWLGYGHPDPKGDKCRLIKGLLQGILNGTTKVTGYWMATVIFQEWGIKAKQLQKEYGTGNGYVWLDYLSIPQLDKTDQMKAIESITGYVALTDLFIVLAGPWTHADDGSIRDVRAWGERGWCRMENLAMSLSPQQKTFIVAQSPTNVFSYGPMGIVGRYWFQEVVGEGTFTVDADRISLGPTILRLIEARKAQAEAEGDLPFFRFLCAKSSRLLAGTGTQLPHLPLDDWLAALRFGGPLEEQGRTGLSPLRFAIIANRADLVAELIALGSDVEDRISKRAAKATAYPELFLPGETHLLTAAGHTGDQDADVAAVLLAAGASTRAAHRNPPFAHPLLHAIVNSNHHLIAPLMRADPDLWMYPHFFGILPFEEAIMLAKPHVTELVLREYGDQLKGHPPGVSPFIKTDKAKCICGPTQREWFERTGGVILVWFAVAHIGDIRVLKQVLDAGHDPNGDMRGHMRHRRLPAKLLMSLSIFVAERQRNPTGVFDNFAHFRQCSPLHLAALRGNLGAVNMLLDYGANPASQMHRCAMTPVHCAAVGGHDTCVDALLGAAPAGGPDLAAVKDNKGRTAAVLAKLRGYHELAARLT